MAMKTIQSQEQREDLRKVLEKIVQELEKSHLYEGKLSIVRVLPAPSTPTNSPAGYPYLMVQEKKCKKFLGIIPCNKEEVIFVVKEGFYDMGGKGRRDMFVRLPSKFAESTVKKHLEEYGKKNQVTEIVYKS